MKFVRSEANDETHLSYSPDRLPVKPSPSSLPFVTEGTSFADIYSYDNGKGTSAKFSSAKNARG